VPDHEISSFKSLDHVSEYKLANKILIKLSLDFKVKIISVSENLKSLIDESKGLKWTMIYDEGFEVSLGSLRLFHFNHY